MNGTKWTETEVNFLKENYFLMSAAQIGEELGRSERAVTSMAQNCRLLKSMPKKWTDEEWKFLKDNYEEISVREISEKLGRTENAIWAKLCIIKTDKQEYGFWTTGEVDFLKKNYGVKPAAYIACELNRSENSVYGMAERLGLRKTTKEKTVKSRKMASYYSEDEINFILGNHKAMTADQIAKYLGRKKKGVYLKMFKLGVNRDSLKIYTDDIRYFYYNTEEDLHKKLDYCIFWIRALKERKKAKCAA